jgi:predicted dinucleotide-binding enzyme
VRAFNTLGFEMFAAPTVGGELADLFWCGPEDAGVEQLIADVGLRPVRVGDLDAIDVVDGVARLWLTLVFRQGHPRRTAFRMLAD